MNLAVQRWLPVGVFALALAAAAPRLEPHAAPRFALPANLPETPSVTTSAPVGAVPSAPTSRESMLPNPQPSAHAATLAELPNGHVAAAWFAGSREGAGDVAIHFSTFDGQQWQAPRSILTRKQAQRDAGRLVRKLGNPLLATDATGKLHLWFVSVGYGGWAGSAINHTTSADGGQTWSRSERLVTSPFWNLSTLVRTPPLALADDVGGGGGFGLPIYHEFAAKRAEWLRLDAAGRVLDKARIPASQKALQPAVAVLDARRAVAMMRDAGPANRIRLSVTADAGQTWQDARPTPLPNPNAAIALLRLADGRLLLAWNPQAANRNKLALSTSSDEGTSWSAPRLVENAAGGEEFSYPALLQSRDGTLHLAYTWQRKTIKHLAFSPAWLENDASPRPPSSTTSAGAVSPGTALREPSQ